MRPSHAFFPLPSVGFIKALSAGLFRRALQRRVVCCAVAFNLLLWPGPGLVSRHVLSLASQALSVRWGVHSYEAFFLRRLFSQSRSKPRRETMADRASAVARIRISPVKFVGYENEGATFTALPTDFLERSVEGVKFTWESSNPDKLQIDDAGRAKFLQPGLARVTCRTGSASATAAVLIRPSHRPVQSDDDWRNDQKRLDAGGNIVGEASGPQSNVASSVSSAGSLLSSLLDKLMPTAYAQYSSTDLAYSELWSEPRNLAGSPRDRAIESTAMGTVLPEGSNFKWSVPIIGLGGRGIGASLVLSHNNRVWSRRDSRVAYDAITGWPAPGYSLGFGRIVVYDLGVGGYLACKFLLVDPDGTRHYLGAGTYDGIGYALGGPIETSDGTHIVYWGNGRDGGLLHYPDGTTVNFTAINNRLLPATIYDSNGNYVQVAYKDLESEIYSPVAIDYVIDTLGRKIQFIYDSSGKLISITAPGFGGTSQNPVTRTLVEFDYQTVTTNGTFSGLTVERATGGSIVALKHVYFPATNTGYKPAYSVYGMISSVSARRQMSSSSWPPGSPPSITDGVESAAVSFNYPASGPLSDAPAFTQRTETAVNSPSATYTYSTSTDTTAQTMTFTIARPDSTTLALTRSTNASSPANGRVVQSEIKLGSTSLGKSVLAYVNDGGGSPQVQSVISYDDTGAPVKIDFDYDQYGNVTNKREYGNQISGAWQVRRRTHLTYGIAYKPRLVTLVEAFDGLQNSSDADDVLIAKTSYAYDNYAAMGGMEDYGGGADPPGHFIGWNTSYTTRGNVTGVTEWTDLQAGTTVQHLAKIDIFGNVVKAQVSCCQEKDLTNTEATLWSQAEEETSGDPSGVAHNHFDRL